MATWQEILDWIPIYINQDLERPDGYQVSADEYNELFNLNIYQGDGTTDLITDMINVLDTTFLGTTDAAINVTLDAAPSIAAANVKAALLELLAKIESNDVDIANGVQALTDHKASSDHDHRYYTEGEVDLIESGLQDGINAEIAARTAADTTLQSNIDAEASSRTLTDAALQDAIDAEELTRGTADITLQNNINAEAASRTSADTTLQNNIDAEANSRSLADAAIQAAVDANDLAAVHVAGAETITGDKNFAGRLTQFAAPTLNEDVTNKEYVDDLIALVVGGQIPDGSVTDDKLSNEAGMLKDRMTDLEAAAVTYSNGSSVLPTTGWVASATDYALELSVAVAGIEATDLVDIIINVDDLNVAQDAEIASTAESTAGGITFYANTAPASSISFNWKVVR